MYNIVTNNTEIHWDHFSFLMLPPHMHCCLSSMSTTGLMRHPHIAAGLHPRNTLAPVSTMCLFVHQR